MKRFQIAASGKSPIRERQNAMRGFTLIELLVATAVFLVIAAAAFSLFNQHVTLATHQQNLSTVNIGLRNAMTQLEMDLSGAGQNLLSGVAGAGQPFSLGVIINNSVPGTAPACAPAANWSYPVPSACFDSLTIINPKTCPVLDINDPGNSQESLNSSSIMWGDDPNNPGDATTLTSDASCFKSGDEILVLQLPGGGQQQVQCDNGPFTYCIATVVLTKDAQVAGNKIQLQHNPSGTGVGPDPLGILSNGSGATNYSKANALNTDFSNGAYIIDIGDGTTAVTYSVQPNPTNPFDPQLVRCAGTVCTAGNQQLLTDQVIGFKVGAALWDNAQNGPTDLANYFFDASKYCNDAVNGADCTQTPPPANDPYDFTLIRAIRISMIGRTRPNADPSLSAIKNGLDNGPYLVQQASVVVDLRNLSNPESTN